MKYAGSGLVGTVLHYLVLYLLVIFTPMSLIVASTLGAIIGAELNYMLAYGYVFASQTHHIKSMPKFALVTASGIVINMLIIAFSASFMGAISSQLFATISVFLWGYNLNKRWSFCA